MYDGTPIQKEYWDAKLVKHVHCTSSVCFRLFYIDTFIYIIGITIIYVSR